MKTSKLTSKQKKNRSLATESAKGFLLILLALIIIGADYSQARNNINFQSRSGSSELQYMEHQLDALTIYEVKFENLMTDGPTWKPDSGSYGFSLEDALEPEPEKEIELEDWMLGITP